MKILPVEYDFFALRDQLLGLEAAFFADDRPDREEQDQILRDALALLPSRYIVHHKEPEHVYQLIGLGLRVSGGDAFEIQYNELDHPRLAPFARRICEPVTRNGFFDTVSLEKARLFFVSLDPLPIKGLYDGFSEKRSSKTSDEF